MSEKQGLAERLEEAAANARRKHQRAVILDEAAAYIREMEGKRETVAEALYDEYRVGHLSVEYLPMWHEREEWEKRSYRERAKRLLTPTESIRENDTPEES